MINILGYIRKTIQIVNNNVKLHGIESLSDISGANTLLPRL